MGDILVTLNHNQISAKETTRKKIEMIVRKQFHQEMKNKEKELDCIDQVIIWYLLDWHRNAVFDWLKNLGKFCINQRTWLWHHMYHCSIQGL